MSFLVNFSELDVSNTIKAIKTEENCTEEDIAFGKDQEVTLTVDGRYLIIGLRGLIVLRSTKIKTKQAREKFHQIPVVRTVIHKKSEKSFPNIGLAKNLQTRQKRLN